MLGKLCILKKMNDSKTNEFRLNNCTWVNGLSKKMILIMKAICIM